MHELDWMGKAYSEYDQKRQVIYDKKQLRQDIIGNIAVVPYEKHFELSCEFSFFNYGQDIRLSNGCKDDFFITGIGMVKYAYVVEDKSAIEIESKSHNEKYGDWALVNLTINNKSFSDVFMTPLSFKAYREDDKDHYIFIQIVFKEKYMNVLFYGGPRECLVVADCPNAIYSNSYYHINSIKSGPGQFWH